MGQGDARSVRLYGSHPSKLGHSTWLVLAAFGVKDKLVESFTDKIVAYRGGIKEGDVAEIELRITTKNADVAKELLKAYETSEEDADAMEARETEIMLGLALKDPYRGRR